MAVPGPHETQSAVQTCRYAHNDPRSIEPIGRFWPGVAKERPIVSKVSAGVPTDRNQP